MWRLVDACGFVGRLVAGRVWKLEGDLAIFLRPPFFPTRDVNLAGCNRIGPFGY